MYDRVRSLMWNPDFLSKLVEVDECGGNPLAAAVLDFKHGYLTRESLQQNQINIHSYIVDLSTQRWKIQLNSPTIKI